MFARKLVCHTLCMPCLYDNVCVLHPMYFIIGIKWITTYLFFALEFAAPLFHFMHCCHVRIALKTLLIVLIILHVCKYFRSISIEFNKFAFSVGNKFDFKSSMINEIEGKFVSKMAIAEGVSSIFFPLFKFFAG